MPGMAVTGGGSWGTAILKILTESPAGSPGHWWMRSRQQLDHIAKYGHNPTYLSSVDLKTGRQLPGNDLKHIIASADTLIFCVPSAFLHETLSGITPENFGGKTVVSAIKGFVPQDNRIVGEYFHQRSEEHTSELQSLMRI